MQYASFGTSIAIWSTEIIEHSGLRYRIELRNDGGAWHQRHVWYPAPRTYVDGVTIDKWIPTSCRPDQTFNKAR